MANALNGSSYSLAMQADFYGAIVQKSKVRQAPLIPSGTIDADGNFVKGKYADEAVESLFAESLYHNIILTYNDMRMAAGFDSTKKPINIRDAMTLRDKHNLRTVKDFNAVIDELFADEPDAARRAELAQNLYNSAYNNTVSKFKQTGIEVTANSAVAVDGAHPFNFNVGYVNVPFVTSVRDPKTRSYTTKTETHAMWKLPISPFDPRTRNLEHVIDSGMRSGYMLVYANKDDMSLEQDYSTAEMTVTPGRNLSKEAKTANEVAKEKRKHNRSKYNDKDVLDIPYKLRANDSEKNQTSNGNKMTRALRFCPLFLAAKDDVPLSDLTTYDDDITLHNAMSINDVLGISLFKPYCDANKMQQLADAFTMNKITSTDPTYETKFRDLLKGSQKASGYDAVRTLRRFYKTRLAHTATIMRQLSERDVSFDITAPKEGLVKLDCNEIIGTRKKPFTVTVLDVANAEMLDKDNPTSSIVSEFGVIMADGLRYDYTTYKPINKKFKATRWEPSCDQVMTLVDGVRGTIDMSSLIGSDKDHMIASSFKGVHFSTKGQYFVLQPSEAKDAALQTIFVSDVTANYDHTQLSGMCSILPEKTVEADLNNGFNVKPIVAQQSSLTVNARFSPTATNRIVVRDPDSADAQVAIDDEENTVLPIRRFMFGYGPLNEHQIAIVNAMGMEYGSYNKFGHLIDKDGNVIDDKFVLTYDDNSCVLAENKETGKQEFVSTGVTVDDLDVVLDEDNNPHIVIKPDTKSIAPYFDSKYRVIKKSSNQTSPNYGLAGNMLVTLINKARVEVKRDVNLDGLMAAYDAYKAQIDNHQEKPKFEFTYSDDNAIALLQKQYVRALKSLAEGSNTALEYTKWDCTSEETAIREQAIKDYITEGKPYDTSRLSENDILILDAKTYVEDAEDDSAIREALTKHLESYCNEYFGNPFEKRILPNGNVTDEMGRFSPHRLKELVDINVVQQNSALPAIHTLVELMQLSGLNESSFTEDAVFVNKFTGYQANLDHSEMFDMKFSGTFDEDGTFHMDPNCLHMKAWENWKALTEESIAKRIKATQKANPSLSMQDALKYEMNKGMLMDLTATKPEALDIMRQFPGRNMISFLASSKYSDPFYAEYADMTVDKIREKENEARQAKTIVPIRPVNDPHFASKYAKVGEWIDHAVVGAGGELETIEVDGKKFYDINIDESTGIVCYKYRKNTNKVNQSSTDVMTGYIGPVFMPETVTNIDGTSVEVIKTKFNKDKTNGNKKVIVPGYEAYISATDVWHTTTEERTRLVGFEQRLKSAIESRVRLDVISGNMTKAVMSDRSLDFVYSNVADTSYDIDFFNSQFCPMDWEGSANVLAEAEALKMQIANESDPNKRADLQNMLDAMKDNRDLMAAKVREAGSRIRFPNEVREGAGLHAYERFKTLPEAAHMDAIYGKLQPDILELADFNDLDMVPETSDGYFDTVFIGQAKNQSCVRYLPEGAEVADVEGSVAGCIVPVQETEAYKNADDETKSKLLKSPIRNCRYMRYSEFNPQDRIQMAASQLMDATCCVNNVVVCQTSMYGFNFEDDMPINKKFAERAKIYHGNGLYAPLVIQDKLSCCNGNKGVISLVIDPDWTEEDIENLPVHENKKNYIKKCWQFFRLNPTVDIVFAPASALSRFNAGLGRSLIDNQKEMVANGETVDMILPDENGNAGEVLPGRISRTDIIVTNITAASKVHIYEGPNEGRKMSGHLSWAYMANGCDKALNAVYKNSDTGVHNFTEGLRSVGVIIDDEGRFAVDNTPVEDMNLFVAESGIVSDYAKYDATIDSDVASGTMTEEDAETMRQNVKCHFDDIKFETAIPDEVTKLYKARGGKKNKLSASEYRTFIGDMVEKGEAIPVSVFATKIADNIKLSKAGEASVTKFIDRIHLEEGYLQCPVNITGVGSQYANIGNYVTDREGNVYLPVVAPALRMDMIQTLNPNSDDGGKNINTLTTKNDISSDYMKLYDFIIKYNEGKVVLQSDVNILKSLRVAKIETTTSNGIEMPSLDVPDVSTSQKVKDSQQEFNKRHDINAKEMTYGNVSLMHSGAARFVDGEEDANTMSLGEWAETTLLAGMCMKFDENGNSIPVSPNDTLAKQYNKFNEVFAPQYQSGVTYEQPELRHGGLTVAMERSIMTELMKHKADICDYLSDMSKMTSEDVEYKKQILKFFGNAAGLDLKGFNFDFKGFGYNNEKLMEEFSTDEINEIKKNRSTYNSIVQSLKSRSLNRARLLLPNMSRNDTAIESLTYLAKHDSLGGFFKTFAEKQFVADGLDINYFRMSNEERLNSNANGYLTKSQFLKALGEPMMESMVSVAARLNASNVRLTTPAGIDIGRISDSATNAICCAAAFNNIFTGNNPRKDITRSIEIHLAKMTDAFVHKDEETGAKVVDGDKAETYATLTRLKSAVNADQKSMTSLANGLQGRWSKIIEKITSSQFNGKKNGIRMGIVPKRLDYSATSVMAGDPSLPVNAVGMPSSTMKVLKLRSYEESFNKVDDLVKNAYPDADVDKLIAATGIGSKDKSKGDHKAFVKDVKEQIEMLADYCRVSSIRNVLIEDMKLGKNTKNVRVREEDVAKARELRENILKTICMTDNKKDIPVVTRRKLMSLALDFSETRDHVLVWRDPVLRKEATRYMEVYRDDTVKGMTINPVMGKGWDMDFDGDCTGNRTMNNPTFHMEAMEKLRIASHNIADAREISYEFGHEYDTEYRVYKSVMQSGLDLASAEARDEHIEIADGRIAVAINDVMSTRLNLIRAVDVSHDAEMAAEKEKLVEYYTGVVNEIQTNNTATLHTIRETFETIGSNMLKEYEATGKDADAETSNLCVDIMNLYTQEALSRECGTDSARYDGVAPHFEALKQMVDHGVKGNVKKMKSYAQYFGIENIDKVFDADNEFHPEEITGMQEKNNITQAEIRATQKAQSVKSIGTGVAGELTINAVKDFVDLNTSRADFTAIIDALELTSQISQATLQAKHDAAEAIVRYAAISGPAKDMLSGAPLRFDEKHNRWYVEKDPVAIANTTKEEWVDSVVGFVESEYGLNIKPVNKFNIENLSEVVFREEKTEPVAFFAVGYQAGAIFPKLDEAIENHAELFEGKAKIYASSKFLAQIERAKLSKLQAENLEAQAEAQTEAVIEDTQEHSVFEDYTEEMQEEEVGYVYSQVTTKNNAEEPDIPESSDNDFESDSDDEQTGEENPDVPA